MLATLATLITPMALNTDGIQAFLLTKVVPLVLAGIGVLIIVGATKGNWSKAFNTFGIVLLGIVLMVGAGGLVLFGEELSGVVFTGGGRG